MQPLRNCNGPTIRIGREILCLPYAGFFFFNITILSIVILQGMILRRYIGTFTFQLRN